MRPPINKVLIMEYQDAVKEACQNSGIGQKHAIKLITYITSERICDDLQKELIIRALNIFREED